jgi:ankyrin repeat protein
MTHRIRPALALALGLLVVAIRPGQADYNLLPDRTTSIIMAALNNDLDRVKGFLAKGVSPNTVDGDNRTVLIYAATSGNAPLAKLVLDAGAKTTLLDKTGNSALHYAAERGNVEVLSMMLDAKAPPDVLNKQGATPLLIAAGRGRIEAVRLLLARGASVSKQDYSGHDALSWAQDNRQNGIVQILRQAGAK